MSPFPVKGVPCPGTLPPQGPHRHLLYSNTLGHSMLSLQTHAVASPTEVPGGVNFTLSLWEVGLWLSRLLGHFLGHS